MTGVSLDLCWGGKHTAHKEVFSQGAVEDHIRRRARSPLSRVGGQLGRKGKFQGEEGVELTPRALPSRPGVLGPDRTWTQFPS